MCGLTSRIAAHQLGKRRADASCLPSCVSAGVGDALLTKAIADAAGKTLGFVKEAYQKDGDLGIVAAKCKATQRMLMKPKALTIPSVFKTLREIALASGKDSAKVRQNKIQHMLVASTGDEPQFVVRALQGKMRIGLADATVTQALAMAIALRPAVDGTNACLKMSPDALQAHLNSATEGLKEAYSLCPSWETLVPKLLEKGLDAVKGEALELKVGCPVKPMLAKPTKGIAEVLDKLEGCKFTCEYKYDGERAQIHYDEVGGYHIYSRNLENHTTKYPDVIARMPAAVKEGTTSFILDSEV